MCTRTELRSGFGGISRQSAIGKLRFHRAHQADGISKAELGGIKLNNVELPVHVIDGIDMVMVLRIGREKS
jgi:hypothetical protein